MLQLAQQKPASSKLLDLFLLTPYTLEKNLCEELEAARIGDWQAPETGDRSPLGQLPFGFLNRNGKTEPPQYKVTALPSLPLFATSLPPPSGKCGHLHRVIG
jgi:hypothetical protein